MAWRIFNILRVISKHRLLCVLKDFSIISPFVAFLVRLLFLDIFPSKIAKSRRMYFAIVELGPVYIKFGQMLATRPDIIGEGPASELAKLQDKMPEEIGDDILRIIKQEFGKEADEIFEKISTRAVAAASISEVFCGTIKTGEKVAIKVLRPGIIDKFKQEIQFLYSIANFLEQKRPKLRRLKLKEVVRVFERISKKEMNLSLEAAAADELRKNHNNDSGIDIPKIFWSLVSQRILVTEWVNAIPVYKLKSLRSAKIDLHKIAHNLLYMFLNQSYRDGFFHADLHPGNILVKKDETIILLDFGIMERLSKDNQIYLAQILKAFIDKDYLEVAKIHFAANYISEQESMEDFAQACRSVGEMLDGLADKRVSIGKLLMHLFKITEDFSMEVQPQLLMIQKTTIMVEGLVRRLAPEMDMWQEVEPWIANWADRNLKFDAVIIRRLSDFFRSSKSLAKDYSNILRKIENFECQQSEKYSNSNWLISFLLIVIAILLYYK